MPEFYEVKRIKNYLNDADILNNSCIRVGPGIINITTDTANNH